MSLISYKTAEIADAAQQIAQAAQMTEQNHQESLRLVTANAGEMEGHARGGFQDAINIVNAAYARSQEAIAAAGQAVVAANGNMTEKDMALKAQYG